MSLIGSVVERTHASDDAGATSQTPFPVSADPKTGFPAATHRSQRQRKSAFRQNMEAARPMSRDTAIPIIQPTSSKPWDPSEMNWRSSMEAENIRKVASMTALEREEELGALRSKFGDVSDLAEVFKRAKDLRAMAESKRPKSPTIEEVSDEDTKARPPPLESPPSPPPIRNPPHRVASPARPILSRRSSVSGNSRAGTPGVRFAEVTPRDVFTYPSAPTSPKRTALLIEAPPAEASESNVPKIQWHGKIPRPATETTEPESIRNTSSTVSTEHESENDDTPASEKATTSEQIEQGQEHGHDARSHPAVHPLSQVISTASPSSSPSPSPSPPELKLSTSLSVPAPIAFPSTSPISLNLEPDTPEALRLQYFPNEPAPQDMPSLQWMANLPEIPDTPTTSEYAPLYSENEKDAIRFNLAGTPIPSEKAKEMPVYDGLHHNSRTSAGYTLEELFHLARSTAPMQRAMALDALARLTSRVGHGDKGLAIWFPKAVKDGAGSDTAKQARPRQISAEALRKLVVESAAAAMGERGAVGTRAVDCMYAALVVWDRELAQIEDVELTLRGTDSEGSNLHVLPSDYTVPARQTGTTVDDLPLEGILDTITRQLSARSLPRSVLRRLLEIVVRLARQSKAYASTVMTTPELVPETMRLFVLSGSHYPDGSEEQPDVLAIRLLIILARASRQNASALLDPTDALLRFVAVLPPVELSPDLLVATLDLYAVLGRYGMYSHIATTAAASFESLNQYVRTRRDTRLTRSWIGLRAVWTVCATDPHCTTPPHEILWSQIEGWGWGPDTLVLSQDPELEAGLLPDVWAAVAAWVEGARVNGARGGESERTETLEALGDDFKQGRASEVIRNAVSRLSESVSAEDVKTLPIDKLATDASILYAALRLNLALLLPSSVEARDISGHSLELPLDNIFSLMRTAAYHSVWETVYVDSATSPFAYSHLVSLARCLGNYVLLARRINLLDKLEWLRLAFVTLQRLPPSCAEIAAQIIGDAGAAIAEAPGLGDMPDYLMPSLWNSLLPFLLHDLQPDSQAIVSSLLPSPSALPHSATQLLPSRPNLGGKSYGLPAGNDWTLNPLSHLLRSGTSPVFKALPNDWDADEVDVVRTTLALSYVRQTTLSEMPILRLSDAQVVFGCMRVFMLEHDQPHDDSASEIFRDNQVESIMNNLLSKVSLGSTKRSGTVEPSPLETAAIRHLSGQPFYQFYTDLVGLYDAVSFAHPIFSRILLSPLSMNYAIDYRRLFWGDYGHILRSILTELADVPSDSLKVWLWPRETDGEMIGWYLKALMKGGVQGFLRFVAVHHVAASIWPDLNQADETSVPESKDTERTRMIIGAVVHQAGPALMSAIALYDQTQDAAIEYPECWEGRRLENFRRKARLEWAVKLCGERVRGRLEHVFNN